jgi:hypothetical protein
VPGSPDHHEHAIHVETPESCSIAKSATLARRASEGGVGLTKRKAQELPWAVVS